MSPKLSRDAEGITCKSDFDSQITSIMEGISVEYKDLHAVA